MSGSCYSAALIREAKFDHSLKMNLSSTALPFLTQHACTHHRADALKPNTRMSSRHSCQTVAHPSPSCSVGPTSPTHNTQPSQATSPHPPAASTPETVTQPGLSEAPSLRRKRPVSLDLAWQEKREACTSSTVGTLVLCPSPGISNPSDLFFYKSAANGPNTRYWGSHVGGQTQAALGPILPHWVPKDLASF